jgi:Ca2+-binding EF-hand superfamily protein
MPFFRKKKKTDPAPPKAPLPQATHKSGEADGSEGEEEPEDLMGDQSWATTAEDEFSSEVDRMFAEMKATMGPGTGPDIKIGKLGDDEPPEPEPEPEPEPPAPPPPRVKLTKEEKIAKMKALAEKKAAAAAAAAELEPDSELEVVARCEELFEQYDKDGSGDISADEFASLCFDMGFVFEDEADKKLILSMLDTDNDGSISLDEFKVWWVANQDSFFVLEYTSDVKAAIHYFKKFDEDLSGELDTREFILMCHAMKVCTFRAQRGTPGCRLPHRSAETRVDRWQWDAKNTAMSLVFLDTDGDGKVSFNEFLQWYTADGMVKNLIGLYGPGRPGCVGGFVWAQWPLNSPCRPFWDRADKDTSGGLNKEEFRVLAKDWDLDGPTADLVHGKYNVKGDGEIDFGAAGQPPPPRAPRRCAHALRGPDFCPCARSGASRRACEDALLNGAPVPFAS